MLSTEVRDQFGRPVYPGDTVTLTGKVVDLLGDPDYVNCTVLLDEQLPPSGAQVRLDCNTMQLIKTNPGQPAAPRLVVSRLVAGRSERDAMLYQINVSLNHARTLLQRLMQIDQTTRYDYESNK